MGQLVIVREIRRDREESDMERGSKGEREEDRQRKCDIENRETEKHMEVGNIREAERHSQGQKQDTWTDEKK